MERFRVTRTEFAPLVGVSISQLNAVAIGKSRPTDALKVLIAECTLAIEKALDVRTPRGVQIMDWFGAEVAMQSHPRGGRARRGAAA